MRLSPRSIAILRVLLLTLAGLGTAVALFVLVENIRGDRAWAAVERELQSKGERLDFAALQPAAVPDDENFFKAPMLSHLLYERPDDPVRKKLLNDIPVGSFPPVLSGAAVEQRDFLAVRETFVKHHLISTPPSGNPAADLFAAMEPLRPLLDELRDSARLRPRAAFESRATPLDPPQVAADTIFTIGRALGLRAAVEVELGRAAEAHGDLIALQRLANALATPPRNLLNVLVGLALHGPAANAISDGCRRDLWTNAQLGEFQGLLGEFHPLARFGDAIRSERASFLYVLDTPPRGGVGEFRWPWWLFHGWRQQNKVAYCRRSEAELFAAFTAAPERIFSDRLVSPSAKNTSARLADLRHPYDSVANLALFNVGYMLNNVGESSQRLRLHGVAWGIERYRLTQHREPASLTALAPTFLPAMPVGIFDGQPVRYTARPDGRGHQLYALGRNGRDDNGEGDDLVLTLDDAR